MFLSYRLCLLFSVFFFFQAEDGIRDLVRSRGLGDVYKRQSQQAQGFTNEPSSRCRDRPGLRLSRGKHGAGRLGLSLIHI